MLKPTIHLNGSNAASLRDEYLNACHALDDAILAIQKIDVNGRDYYPQGPDAATTARNEHFARIQSVTKVKDELMELCEHCDRFAT